MSSIGNSDGNAGVILNVKDAEKVGFFTHDYDVQIDDFGNGWHRYSFQFTTSGTSGYWLIIMLYHQTTVTSYSGDGINGVYIYGAQLVEGTEPLDYQYTNGRVGIPRIDFSDGVGSLLLEPQRSNLLLQSNSFDTTWVQQDTSVTSGHSGIYGSSNAWKIETTGGSFSRISQSFNVSGTHTATIYAKKAEYNYIGLFLQSVNVGIVVSLLDGSVVNSILSYPSIYADAEDVGNGWYKISMAHTLTGTGDFRIYPCETTTFDENTTHNQGIYIQHAQLESGSYPTSIIETTTTSSNKKRRCLQQ